MIFCQKSKRLRKLLHVSLCRGDFVRSNVGRYSLLLGVKMRGGFKDGPVYTLNQYLPLGGLIDWLDTLAFLLLPRQENASWSSSIQQSQVLETPVHVAEIPRIGLLGYFDINNVSGY